jgi:uncharacterized protein YjbI with pentapeptide repeats
MAQSKIDWPTCVEPDCIGIQLAGSLKFPGADRCLAHSEDRQRDAAMTVIGETGDIDARGVQFKDDLLAQALDATPRDDVGRRMIKTVRFEKAAFDRADFAGTVFSDSAVFNDARFGGDTSFDGATFSGETRFGLAVLALRGRVKR